MGITFIDEWLVAEGTSSDRWYVVHTTYPRFILEMLDESDGSYTSGQTMLIDECLDASVLARFARLAGEVFGDYDRNLDQD